MIATNLLDEKVTSPPPPSPHINKGIGSRSYIRALCWLGLCLLQQTVHSHPCIQHEEFEIENTTSSYSKPPKTIDYCNAPKHMCKLRVNKRGPLTIAINYLTPPGQLLLDSRHKTGLWKWTAQHKHTHMLSTLYTHMHSDHSSLTTCWCKEAFCISTTSQVSCQPLQTRWTTWQTDIVDITSFPSWQAVWKLLPQWVSVLPTPLYTIHSHKKKSPAEAHPDRFSPARNYGPKIAKVYGIQRNIKPWKVRGNPSHCSTA